MKVTELYVYPIKALRGIRLEEANLGPQGLEHDRRFMLCKVGEDGGLVKMQLSQYPECALFEQEVCGEYIRIRYLTPKEPLVAPRPEQETTLEVPLEPDITDLQKTEVNVHQSLAMAYRMGPKYDVWFSACFGFSTALLFIGDGRRPILGTFAPKHLSPAPSKMLSLTKSLIWGAAEDDWITFSDCAPYLVATQASLNNVRARLASGDVEMYKFRPNIVIDGEEQWDEDFWTTLCVGDRYTLTLTKMCNRCSSLNVDYDTGRRAEGERGIVLKKLMSDRRVDLGARFAPVFGRYGFLTSSTSKNTAATVAVGDNVTVTSRATQRTVWDWPLKDPRASRHYHRTDAAITVYRLALMLLAAVGLLLYQLQST